MCKIQLRLKIVGFLLITLGTLQYATAATEYGDGQTCSSADQCLATGAVCAVATGAAKVCRCADAFFLSGSSCLANVEIAISQNDVRFVNVEGLRNIRINVQLADNQSIAYIRLYINDTTENQTTMMVGPSQVEVMSGSSTECTHKTFPTTGLNSQLSQVGENFLLELTSTTTIFLQSGRYTKLALLSLTGEARFKNVPQKDMSSQFVNNTNEQSESIKFTFPLTTPLIDQPEGTPTATAPPDEYPGLAPVVPKYSNSLSKSMPRSHDERSLSKRSTSADSGGSNSSSEEEECMTDCYCPCGWVEEPKNYTQKKIASIVSEIQERLKVDIKNLTSTQRRLKSAPDNRPSAKAVGGAGVIFLVLILGAIFVVDIGNIVRDLKTKLLDNLRQGFGCKGSFNSTD